MAIALSGNSDANNIAGTSSQVSSENKRNEGEMVGGCSVCPSDQGTDENPLVYCDGCEMAVHQACYGIVSVPEGPWYCRKCESGGNQNKAKCALCPSGDGALKKTDNGQWAHVICGLYIPEVRFGNNNTMEPIEIRYIKPHRLNRKCYLCEEGGNSTMSDYGAVIDCSEQGCKQSFHVTCGQSANLLCEKPAKDDVLHYVGYCEHHFRKTKAANRKSTNSVNNSSFSTLDSAGDSSQDNDSRCNKAGQDKNTSNPRPRFPAAPTLSVSSASNQVEFNDAVAQDVHKWSSSSREETTTNEKSPVNGKTTSKKKPTTANTQSSVNATTTIAAAPVTTTTTTIPIIPTTKSVSPPPISTITTDPQSSSITTNYATAKTGSPNHPPNTTSLSISSPSNSTSATSTSSSSTSSSSSSSTTSSNSTSPALLSPNVSSRKSSTARVESPLASNHKTGSNIDLHNKTPQESNPGNVTRPSLGQNSIQARINLDSSKKNTLASSSLLSTAVPILHESASNPFLGSSVTVVPTTGSNIVTTASTLMPSFNLGNNNLSGSTPLDASSSLIGPANSVFNSGTQPIVPPIIIPAPPSTNNNPTMKSTAKSKASVKVTRKKSTEANESQQKPEPKPKARRNTKAAAAAAAASADSNNTESPPKTETKRGKGKAVAKPTSSISHIAPEAATATTTTTTSKAKAATPAKRKSRTASAETTSVTSGTAPSPAKRPRKKKADQIPKQNSQTPLIANSSSVPQSTSHMQPLSATSNIQIGTSPLLVNTPNMGNNRLLQVVNSGDGQDMSNRYFPSMISPYANFDHSNAPSLTRSSININRLFSSSLANNNNNQTNPADDPAKAFEELRESTWSNLSKCVLEQAQQFDIPSLIGTLYSLRSENEKLVNKVRDLTSKRDQLVAINARLDMPGPMLAQHLSNTSPNFSSVVSGLSNSPKSLPTPSPGSTMGKQPHMSVGSFNHVPTGSICPGYLDRSSPLVTQTHSGLNNIKSSSISTPSPPISALMAHSNNNRAGLISTNSSFMSNVFPAMNNPLSQLGTNPQGSSYYQRQ